MVLYIFKFKRTQQCVKKVQQKMSLPYCISKIAYYAIAYIAHKK